MNRVVGYFREVRAELKKVTWPSRQETVVFTVVVIVSVVIVTLVLWGIDLVLGQLMKLIV